MNKNIGLLCFLFALLLLISCESKEIDPLQQKIKNAISEIKGNVSETVIDVGKANEITLSPVFTLSSDNLQESGLFFADISAVYFADSTYYVVDSRQNTIFMLNQQFEHIGNIGQYGRGPVDFQQPSGIFRHNDRYFVADNGNLRVQILDADFNVLTVIPDITFIAFYPHVSVSKDYLAILNYTPLSEYLLTIFSHNDYSNTIKKLMPRILELGEMPMSLNFVQFSMNRQATFAGAYTALPHIFVYDTNFEMSHYLTIEGLRAFDSNGNYRLFSELATDAQPITRNRINSLLIDENKNLFFVNRAENIIYFLKYDSGRYKSSSKLKLEGLSENPLMLGFIVGEHLAIVDKKYGDRVSFYKLY